MKKESWKLEVGRWKVRACGGPGIAIPGLVVAVMAVMASGRAWGQGTGNVAVSLGQAPGMVSVPRSALAPLVLPEWPKRDAGKLVISGQKLEKPDLQYALLPRFSDTEVGNAAVPYYQAAAKLPAMPAEGEKIISEVAKNAALASLDENDPRLKAALAEFEQALKYVHDGARLDHVDWQLPLRTQGISLLLPHLGQLRWLASALVVKTRLAIKGHRWKEAQGDLQTGYMLTRHLGDGDTLIESLVGVAIARMMNQCVQDWVGEPGSPNLYWALTNLPAPFNDFRKAMAGERDFVYFTLPEMKDFRAGVYSAAAWGSAMAHMRELGGVVEGRPTQVPEWQRQALGTAAAVGMYPQAKAYLKERGMAEEAVEKMAVAEALERYFVQSFDEAQDDMLKWMGLPPAERAAGLKAWEASFAAQKGTNQVNILTAMMLPSVGKAVGTGVRLDREIAALRVVEAIRAYAGEKGKLPGSLGELTLPVPVDPLGRGFVYRQDGAGAVLSSPEEVEAGDAVRFEVTLR